jgi:hypothetical protein
MQKRSTFTNFHVDEKRDVSEPTHFPVIQEHDHYDLSPSKQHQLPKGRPSESAFKPASLVSISQEGFYNEGSNGLPPRPNPTYDPDSRPIRPMPDIINEMLQETDRNSLKSNQSTRIINIKNDQPIDLNPTAFLIGDDVAKTPKYSEFDCISEVLLCNVRLRSLATAGT